MEIAIEKNVPLPPSRTAPSGGLTAVMRTMEVGDSFLVDAAKHKAAYVTAKQVGIKVAVRKVGPSAQRVWRVA